MRTKVVQIQADNPQIIAPCGLNCSLCHQELRRTGHRRPSVLLYMREVSMRRVVASGCPLQDEVRRERHRQPRAH